MSCTYTVHYFEISMNKLEINNFFKSKVIPIIITALLAILLQVDLDKLFSFIKGFLQAF